MVRARVKILCRKTCNKSVYKMVLWKYRKIIRKTYSSTSILCYRRMWQCWRSISKNSMKKISLHWVRRGRHTGIEWQSSAKRVLGRPNVIWISKEKNWEGNQVISIGKWSQKLINWNNYLDSLKTSNLTQWSSKRNTKTTWAKKNSVTKPSCST